MTISGLLRLAWPYRVQLFLLTAIMLAESAVSLTVPWLTGLLAGNIFLGDTGTDWTLIATIIGLLAAMAMLRALTSIIAGAAGLGVLTDLRAMVHDHVTGLPMSFHQDSRRGDLMSLMTWEIGRLSNYLTSTLVSILPSLVTAIGAIVMMSRIDLRLALVVPALIPVFFLLTKLLGRRLRGISTRVQAAEAEVMASAQQMLEIIPAIKTFTREPETSQGYRVALDRARQASLEELSAHAALSPATQFVAGSAALILLGLADSAMAAGVLTAAGLISFMLYAALLTRPAASLADVWGRTQAARGVLARLSRVLGSAPETGGSTGLNRATGQLAVRDLHFSYPGRPPVLTGIDLDIAAGECIALTGTNGAGKTTLTALMMGLMTPGRGRVLLDGQDIATLRLRDLRRQFGHVPQRPLLFNGTIRDNIAFGHSSAGEVQIEAAARAAQADAFIRSLPDGYDTVIGDAGVKLSGGQSQRVALARAMIKDPPVLILDEATSMYDLEGESAFVEAAVTALSGRTVILITHRPATLALARRVLTLAGGKLTETGT